MAPPHDELFQPGSHGTTFGGGALAASAALAVIDVIEQEKLLAKVEAQAPAWHAALQGLAKKYPAMIKEVRGLGYMVGVAMNVDPIPVVAALREAGMLAVPASGIAIRLLPPLNASVEELAESVKIFDRVLAGVKTA
jgi:acetylornithine aminotransferase/acetylornithine/N-succinyldiaminopimelate aminotransferase